jgi:selenocysteine-specific translation elongation factor
MEGSLIGVFGSNPALKSSFLGSIGKKSETEGIVVYQRNEAGKKYSFLDDLTFPDRIQGYSRIASISDYALYMYPQEGKLAPTDGELAVLLDSLGLNGRVELIDSSLPDLQNTIKTAFKGMKISEYQVEQRDSKSSVIDLSQVKNQSGYPDGETLIYIDRSFNVKGVGLVVLGFILSGTVSIHDKLRLIPDESGGKLAEVKGIQVSDEDQESAGRGVRVGLSLKNVELKDLSKVSWLDNGKVKTSSEVEFDFKQSNYYKQSTIDRDLHLEACGEFLVTRISQGSTPGTRLAKLSSAIPVWKGMSVSVLDLNSKPLRIAGGGTVRS